MKPKPDELTKDQRTKEEVEAELEEGLEDTFPASDPPTATQPVHHERKKF
jgi:hypothetical protein